MLKIGVPSKGRLMEKTFDWFGAHGVTMSRTGNEREYSGAVEGIAGVELVLLSAGEIPRELAAGRIHLGVTGTDLVRDRLAEIRARLLFMVCTTDAIFPPDPAVRALLGAVPGPLRYRELDSPYGHMASGVEWPRLEDDLRWLLDPELGLPQGVRQLGEPFGLGDFRFDWLADEQMALYTLVIAAPTISLPATPLAGVSGQ